MRVFGIDPGTINLGYSVLDDLHGDIHLVNFGLIKISSKIALDKRICILYDGLVSAIKKYSPDEVAIEEPFVGNNVKSAFAIGKAQAISILAAAKEGIPVTKYFPSQVKQVITDFGGSNKNQVKEMIRLQLGLEKPLESNDVADAMAIALCHISNRRVRSLIIESSGETK